MPIALHAGMEPIAIFPARMQPPHLDHLAALDRALATVPGPMVVGLLVGGFDSLRSLSPNGRGDPFAEEAAEHHQAPRNPYTFLQRAALLEASLSGSARERVRVVAMPRPECAWELVTATFPGPRIWVIPDAGDPFDDAKAAWFTARAEAVARPRVVPVTNGRLVRTLAERGDPALRRHVPAAVADLLEAWREKQIARRERAQRQDAAWRTAWAHEPE